ncbi:C-type lectin domain family 4 member G-like [Nothobranchius furzeri]|uniref:C-type lectin domain family 4 member G-like n=3 Tax=Nothobranchius furzeri TaxID=105023 RepID=A0A9D2Z1P5_NOTFU|nr:C-type lectin domain family 4 member G-like [Nothobranchius furzeri]
MSIEGPLTHPDDSPTHTEVAVSAHRNLLPHTEPQPTKPNNPPANTKGPAPHPDNSTDNFVISSAQENVPSQHLHCDIGCICKKEKCKPLVGAFCPKCDSEGNFLPQQCFESTGYCWCVNIITGIPIPGTETPPGIKPLNCEKPAENSDERKEKHDNKKKERSSEEDSDEEKSDEMDNCPEDWSSFDDRCFIFNENEKTWAEAEFYCQFDGGNLASVHSFEENVFIQSLTRGDSHNFPETWLGGASAARPDFWLWTDGSNFHYENWQGADHKDKDELCLKTNYEFNLKWTAAPCNQTLPFVCSKSLKDDDD